MADINVERKGPNIWPWIIGLIVLALLIWWLASRTGDETRTTPAGTTTDTTAVGTPGAGAMAAPATTTPAANAAGVPEEVETFITFVSATDAQADAGRQHEYTATGLSHLADALDAAAERATERTAGTVDVGAATDRIRERADQLRQSDWQATTHGNVVRDAFSAAAAAMGEVAQARFPNTAEVTNGVNRVRDAAGAIQGTRPLLEQRDQVQTFFNNARDALVAMLEAGAPSA